MTQCHPQCSWMCDDPVCNAECKAVTTPLCECSDANYTPDCHLECAPDACESIACPPCQTICDPSSCPGTISCQEAISKWACRKPSNCPAPKCELQCQAPTCSYTGTDDVWAKKKFQYWWIILILVLVILFVPMHK